MGEDIRNQSENNMWLQPLQFYGSRARRCAISTQRWEDGGGGDGDDGAIA